MMHRGPADLDWASQRTGVMVGLRTRKKGTRVDGHFGEGDRHLKGNLPLLEVAY